MIHLPYLNRTARRRAESRRKSVKAPFVHATRVTRVLGRVSYLHPTKGWRFRRPTPRLALGLAAATA